MKKSLLGLSVVAGGCSFEKSESESSHPSPSTPLPPVKRKKIITYTGSESPKVPPVFEMPSTVNDELRRPKWEVDQEPSNEFLNINRFKSKQSEFLQKFRQSEALGRWNEIREDHFDWWQFPIDSGSLPEYNLRSEDDISALKSDPEWAEGYRESIRLVARSFGWDVENSKLCEADCGGPWEEIIMGNKDVRLYKMIRSTWLFGLGDYLESLRAFAVYIDTQIYKDKGFHYGRIHFKDILLMRHPRK
jgi:hypothetical protein